MLTLREEQLNVVSGGAVALASAAEDKDIIRNDLVVWKGHENMGTGIVDCYFFGKYMVTFDKKTFPWITVKLISGDELTVVGHQNNRPLPPWI